MINTTSGMSSRPHETISISLKDRYNINARTTNPSRVCLLIFSGLCSMISNKTNAANNENVTHTG